jgi:hypothetical protein
MVAAVETRAFLGFVRQPLCPGGSVEQIEHHDADTEDDLVDAPGVRQHLSRRTGSTVPTS